MQHLLAGGVVVDDGRLHVVVPALNHLLQAVDSQAAVGHHLRSGLVSREELSGVTVDEVDDGFAQCLGGKILASIAAVILLLMGIYLGF